MRRRMSRVQAERRNLRTSAASQGFGSSYSSQTIQEAIGDSFWVQHPEHVWLPATVKKRELDKAVLIADSGDKVSLSVDELAELQPVYPDQLRGLEDICNLVNVNEGALLHAVRVRYAQTLIYTRVARTLIALNPFASLPIYSAQHFEQYSRSHDTMELQPHIFGIGSRAVQGLKETTNDQAVLISGESGAGKTESAKLVMSFVADATRSAEEDCMEKVLRSNPVLEAFGNAMTVRNNNSSRFGKWLDLRFVTHNGPIRSLGATVTHYLLEMTRVCAQGPKERGYHVFFQLLEARQQPELQPLGLQEPRAYRYLSEGQQTAPGIDDKTLFEELKEALGVFGIDKDLRIVLFTLLASILSIGNVDFKASGEAAAIADKGPLQRVSELLQVNGEELAQLMVVRKLVVGKEQTLATNRPDQARAVRDALAKLLYGRLFAWLVGRMNAVLAGKDEHAKVQLLGVLDIAGFECFETNSLEQLLINLSNEHLQQHFNQSMFKSEAEECHKEGVEMPPIGGFTDNADNLALIDSKNGILVLLDETCKAGFSSATDETFVNKVVQQQKDHPRFIVPKTTKNNPVFGVRHFAGNVTYSCHGWLEKNEEKLPVDTAALLSSSRLAIVKQFGTELAESNKEVKKSKSVSAGFRLSLRELMAKIHAADPHYIRCVKPNMEKVAGRFTAPAVMEQLLFGGILAAVNIRQQGYAYRVPIGEFLRIYGCIIEQLSESESDRKLVAYREAGSEKERVEVLMDALPAILQDNGHNIGADCFAVGHTKVFTKFVAVHALDDCRQEALRSVAVYIQRIFRGELARRHVAQRRQAQAEIMVLLKRIQTEPSSTSTRRRATSDLGGQDHGMVNRLRTPDAAKSLLAELGPLLGRCEQLGFANAVVVEAEWVSRRLRRELGVVEQAGKLLTSTDSVAIEKVQAQAKHLDLPALQVLEDLQSRLAKLKVQLPLAKSLETALGQFRKATQVQDGTAAQLESRKAQLECLEAAMLPVESAGLRKAPEAWLPELRGGQLVEDVLQAMQRLLEATDREAAEKLAAERAAAAAQRSKAEELASAKAKTEQLEKEALRKKGEADAEGGGPLTRKLTTERLAVVEEFQRKLAEERAAMEAAVAQRLRAEQARVEAEKEREAAMQVARAVEQRLREKMEAERTAAEQEFEARLKEVAERLTSERAARETDFLRRLEAEKLKAEEAQRQVDELAVKEQSAQERLQLLAKERADAEAAFQQALAGERLTAEKELSEKLAGEKAKAQQELAEKLAVEKGITAEEVTSKLTADFAEAAKALEQRLGVEQAAAQKELEDRVAAHHEARLREFLDKLERKHATAERSLMRDLMAEKAKALGAQARANQAVADLAAERAAMEKEVVEKLAQERAAAEEVFMGLLRDAKAEAEKEFSLRVSMEKRGRRDVPGLVVSERSQILARLGRAVAEFDAAALGTLLGLVAEDGIEDEKPAAAGEADSPVATAKALLENLQQEPFVADTIADVQEQASEPNPSLLVLRQLQNLLVQQRKLCGLVGGSREAPGVLQKALVDLARFQGLKSIFDTQDPTLASLASEAFGALELFSRLKPASSWTGSGRPIFARRPLSRKPSVSFKSRSNSLASDLGVALPTATDASLDTMAWRLMLGHTRDCISESLTIAPRDVDPDEYDTGASLNFVNVVVSMGDKPAQDCQRQSCTDAVLDLASGDSGGLYREEVYLQAMKQLTSNPAMHSARRGWTLLHKLCSTAPPPTVLAEFLRVFIRDRQAGLLAQPEAAAWSQDLTTKCLEALEGRSLWQRAEAAWESLWWVLRSGPAPSQALAASPRGRLAAERSAMATPGSGTFAGAAPGTPRPRRSCMGDAGSRERDREEGGEPRQDCMGCKQQ